MVASGVVHIKNGEKNRKNRKTEKNFAETLERITPRDVIARRRIARSSRWTCRY